MQDNEDESECKKNSRAVRRKEAALLAKVEIKSEFMKVVNSFKFLST